jgi:hypothetical protein
MVGYKIGGREHSEPGKNEQIIFPPLPALPPIPLLPIIPSPCALFAPQTTPPIGIANRYKRINCSWWLQHRKLQKR